MNNRKVRTNFFSVTLSGQRRHLVRTMDELTLSVRNVSRI